MHICKQNENLKPRHNSYNLKVKFDQIHTYHNKYCYVAHCLVSSVETVEAAHVSVLVPVDQLAVVPDELQGCGSSAAALTDLAASAGLIGNSPSCVIILCTFLFKLSLRESGVCIHRHF